MGECLRLVQQTTVSGDECHHNIEGLSDKDCRKLLLESTLSEYEICAATGLRTVEHEDLL